MTKEQFECEKKYQAMLSVTRAMLRAGILIPDDVSEIDTMMRDKYRPLFGSLYPRNRLIYNGIRGNIPATEGGSYGTENTKNNG
jgi:hypothetical protein